MADSHIPGAELDVLACLHRLKRATAAQIRECMAPYRPMAHGSVLTLLKRLEAKTLVAKKKGPVGKAFVYRTTRRASSTYANLLGRLLHRVFAGDSVALVASLFEGRPPSRKELKDLQNLLDELKKNAEGGRS
jgi:predicted transcriptional regulator